MFENIKKWFKKAGKTEEKNETSKSKEAAKERLHLVLVQDRANVSVDFLELMKQEIIDVIKKYVEVDEKAIDVSFTNTENEDGTSGTPALYANIPILNIKNEARKLEKGEIKNENEIKPEQEEKILIEEVVKEEEIENQEEKEEEAKEQIKSEQKVENEKIDETKQEELIEKEQEKKTINENEQTKKKTEEKKQEEKKEEKIENKKDT